MRTTEFVLPTHPAKRDGGAEKQYVLPSLFPFSKTAGSPAASGSARNPLNLQPITTHPTSWRPSSARVTLNISLDACIVPDASGDARVDKAHLIVLDDFIGENERMELLDFITRSGWDPKMPPPGDKWERATRDSTDAAPTWGLRDEALHSFATFPLAARLEVQSRLQALYPDYLIAHMPSNQIQASRQQGQQQQGEAGPAGGVTCMETEMAAVQQQKEDGFDDVDREPLESLVDCNQFVANAAMLGDSYSWHVDADPSTFPFPSPWTKEYGQYVNREPTRPLFVSLLLYLNHNWEREWDAETLFLDTPTDCGVVVRPKAYRAVLLDQDILHRLSAPSRAALGRARYSLVWKLVMLPRGGQVASLAREAWGRPAPFGSVVALERVVSGLAMSRSKAVAAVAAAEPEVQVAKPSEQRKRKRKKRATADSQEPSAKVHAAADAPAMAVLVAADKRGTQPMDAVLNGQVTKRMSKRRRQKHQKKKAQAGAVVAAAATCVPSMTFAVECGVPSSNVAVAADYGVEGIASYGVGQDDDGSSDHDVDASGGAGVGIDTLAVQGGAQPMVTPGGKVARRRRQKHARRRKKGAEAGAIGDPVSNGATVAAVMEKVMVVADGPYVLPAGPSAATTGA